MEHQHAYEVSIVVPAYNEQTALDEFYRRVRSVTDALPDPVELVFVNDGSTDDTLKVMESLRERDEHVTVVNLSRNFGKEIALTAGLDHAAAHGAVVVIDADLQDPPELISLMLSKWREGYDVVYAKREARHGETAFKRATAHLFYRVIQRLSRGVSIPQDVGDFRLLSRRAVDALLRLREQHRFMKGLFAWIGYPQVAIPYQRDPRFAGKSKWSYWRLWNLSLEGITSFTTAPLRLATYLGLLTALGGFVYGLFIIYKTLVYGEPVQGFPTLITAITFLGGVQLITLGVIGEYLGRIFNETKQRPLYLVQDYHPARPLRERGHTDRST
ncbi:MAG: glycosyltransferase family 2 protein [Gammaproteobacteria bacterium]|nr:glycosyltransferase family 2 protein [Gammaproteobacteria bacterium]